MYKKPCLEGSILIVTGLPLPEGSAGAPPRARRALAHHQHASNEPCHVRGARLLPNPNANG